MSEELTAQEIFDTVVWHLVKQGRRSVRPDPDRDDGLCVYRSPNGDKCAVGALIADDEYSPRMEEVGGVLELFDMGLLPERLCPHRRLLSALQRAHDKSKGDFLAEVRGRLNAVATQYALSTAILDEAAR